jgi:hypothetical protein
MKIKELEDILCGLKQGQFAAINYGFYAELFPRGEPNESARTASYDSLCTTDVELKMTPRNG